MELFVHAPEEKRTYRIELGVTVETFDKALIDHLVHGFKYMPADVQMARVHPNDTYNHKVGRKVAREALVEEVLYRITEVKSNDYRISIEMIGFGKDRKIAKLVLTKFKKDGKVILRTSED